MFYHLATTLNSHPSIAAHPTVPTSAFLAQAAENAMTVMRHCAIRLDELGTAGTDPVRQAAVRGFRAGRQYATQANRHLAEAADSALALESTADADRGDPAAGEREDKLGHEVLDSAAVAYNSLIAGMRAVSLAREDFPPLGTPQPAARRPRSTLTVAAAQGLPTDSGRRRR
ncbi:hypothetical protein [Kitasatospora phosalacinea]|uniref:Uncharacterized protein n=1 Tax=Kitasatospora phosalacinea TaxID=2065 RepID=A0A9W6PNT5_9ACTN|nr:hypothetical protein [Kitasatospora phosalacinea]GLW58186.1 hypothetical protein Kpho01_61970 [Kitasatospora phosalacinea]